MLVANNMFVCVFSIMLYIVEIDYKIQDILIETSFVTQFQILFL